MTMIRKQFFVDADVSQRLKRLAAIRRVSEAELIRQGVAKLLSDTAQENADWQSRFTQIVSNFGENTELAERVMQVKTEQAELLRKRRERLRAQFDEE